MNSSAADETVSPARLASKVFFLSFLKKKLASFVLCKSGYAVDETVSRARSASKVFFVVIF